MLLTLEQLFEAPIGKADKSMTFGSLHVDLQPRYKFPAVDARNSNGTVDTGEPDNPVILGLEDGFNVYRDRNSGSSVLPGTYDPDNPPPLPKRLTHIPGFRPNEPVIDETTSVSRGPSYDHQAPGTETPDIDVSRSSSYLNDDWEVPAQSLPTYNVTTTSHGSDGAPAVPQKSDDEDSSEPWSINASRTKSINAGPRENYAICEPCGHEQPAVAYCSNCGAQFCSYHWAEQWVHRDKSDQRLKDGVPHEKTDPWLANKIKTIIEPSLSQEEQNRLHQQDEDTTWFGVMPDNAGKLMFHDFGRYEQSSLQSRFPQKSSQYPSLISFVGTTGAGKSTLIKGLVKLASSRHGEKSQTPIVGLVQNQHVPTVRILAVVLPSYGPRFESPNMVLRAYRALISLLLSLNPSRNSILQVNKVMLTPTSSTEWRGPFILGSVFFQQ